MDDGEEYDEQVTDVILALRSLLVEAPFVPSMQS